MHKQTMKAFQLTSYLSGGNAAYLEELYESFLQNPDAVDTKWRHYFESLGNGRAAVPDVSHAAIRDQFIELAKRTPRAIVTSAVPEAVQQSAVDQLITAYRRFGHLNAKTDPLGSEPPVDVRLLPSTYQLNDASMQQVFATRGVLPESQATLQEIIAALKQCYANTIGIEYTSILNEDEREWLCEYIEKKIPATDLSVEVKRSVMEKLIAAEGMEKYLDSKYPGQKRFSAEGADVFIPMLDQLAKQARQNDLHEIIIGMAHRGRLNVLLNIMGQSPKELFQEFDGTKDYGLISGDVKYHRGFSTDVNTDAGPVHLSLAFNPSHLEFICPVVMGSTRARQERAQTHHENKYNYAMAVMIHGDAAFAGQGVVMETLSMSQTRAYCIGGTIHIILNNQVGFTMSDPRDARSSHYCSDLAKMIDAPVIHVNGDDPDAVIKVTQLAVDYRMKFHKDIVIDLVCYRRHGHQEVDEPRATQPIMYQIIEKHPTTRAIYAEKLLKQKVFTEEELDKLWLDYRQHLDQGRTVVELLKTGLSDHYAANWTPFIDRDWRNMVDTSVPKTKLIELAKQLETLPEGFKLQRNVEMIMNARRSMTAGEHPLDWGYAETMAYATLLDEGYGVRLSGEDSRRGTFFHRHSALFDQNTGEVYMPLAHIRSSKARVNIYDSLLSEVGALGFEYGYSTADPNSLIMWEAQFGDFANGAQVIIDQFISSGWQKWNRLSGLVMLLPHGYEGMGPEHSSARLERYLQLAAQNNIQVCVPSTPAQIFHLLRRQVLRPYRKPLIVMTPKSLLRHKLAVSTLDDLAKGQLKLVIPEIDKLDANKVKRVVMCSGKVYYDLLTKRREENIENIAIIRIEQLYPFPYDELETELARYKNASEFIWCQEEPKNQGAWFCSRQRLMDSLPKGKELGLVSRPASAAAAAGYPTLHKKQQETLVYEALGLI